MHEGQQKLTDLSRFGTEDFPLHASALSVLVKCPWRVGMIALFGDDGESGPAADTGSAMHRAAEEMHKRGADPATSLKVMQERLHEYPRADLKDAAGIFLAYASDERNRGVDFALVEETVEFRLQAASEDPTGESIVIVGRCDQVRVYGDLAQVWDIKTSKLDGIRLLQDATFQGAAYCVGATYKLGRQVDPGGIILPRRYQPQAPSKSPVFWHFPWKFSDAAQILEPVRYVVAQIRRKRLWHVPSDEMCRWCAARSPDICLPKLQQTLTILKRDAA